MIPQRTTLAALFLSLLAAVSYATPTDSPTTQPTALVAEFKNVIAPSFDQKRREDSEYTADFRKQMEKYYSRRAELARQILDADPNSREAKDCIAAVVNNARMTNKAIDASDYIDLLEKRTTSTEVKRECAFNRAILLINDRQKAFEFAKAADTFIATADPKDPRAASLLSIEITRTSNPAKKKELTDRLLAKYPDSSAAKMMTGMTRQKDQVGKPFVLSFTDAVSGKKIDTKDLKGKVLVVDFWATWCGPCVGEMPENKKIYSEFHDKGVEFLGVSLDMKDGGLDKLKAFVKENQIPWPQYYQGNGWESDFSSSWGIQSIPTVFVVDSNGNLASTEARGQLREILPELIAQRKQVPTQVPDEKK